jgi:hypothetical protein
MAKKASIHVVMFVSAVIAANSGPVLAASARAVKRPANGEKSSVGRQVFWVDPVDISARNLFYGQGGKEHQPVAGNFEFTKEDMNGTNPKFDVKDANGDKWKVKLGDEARPETVATRLVWAVGFHTDEDYFLPAIHVQGMPPHVKRGRQFIEADGTMHNARLKRNIPGQKKMGDWKWSDGLYTGTREWNGLRVLMALINNWDLKDDNNSIYAEKDGELIYVVSDLGASFGPTKLDLGHGHDKGDLNKYRRTKFVRKSDAEFVDFTVPGAPTPIMFVTFRDYFVRRHMVWIGREIPVEDAKWMGSLLARLSAGQIQDAFRAGGYSPAEVGEFATLVEKRIAALNNL